VSRGLEDEQEPSPKEPQGQKMEGAAHAS
jgi:hypothetical protein